MSNSVYSSIPVIKEELWGIIEEYDLKIGFTERSWKRTYSTCRELLPEEKKHRWPENIEDLPRLQTGGLKNIFTSPNKKKLRRSKNWIKYVNRTG